MLNDDITNMITSSLNLKIHFRRYMQVDSLSYIGDYYNNYNK